jgi:diguanylate cyclase (GGDEF)-like protein
MRFGLVPQTLMVCLVGGAYAAWSVGTDAADVATVGVRVSAVLLVGLPCGYFASQMAAELHALSAVTRRLAYRASHDPLTGLANRAFLLERLERLAADASESSPLALMFVDLDGFKAMNDTFGHDVGDEVLVEVAARLRDAAPEAFVARLGGDEFAVLSWPAPAAEAEATAQRIVDALRARADAPATVTASVGIALSRGGVTPTQLLRQADLAMYTAKTEGRARWAYCADRPELESVLVHR